MKILIINPGSTSVKYSLYNNTEKLDSQIFDRKYKGLSYREKKFVQESEAEYYIFRIVHAFEYTSTRILDETTYLTIKEAKLYAPLHNTLALEVMDWLLTISSNNRIICTFDSEFHKQLPRHAFSYALPRELLDKYSIRKYGFHGLAFESVVDEVKSEFGTLPEKIIAIHAGGGVSVCAIKDGISIDTTMGVSPVDGIMMLSRSGSLDPEIIRILQEKERMSSGEIFKLLNFESGFYGITKCKDTKEIIDKAKKNIKPFDEAYQLFLYQIKKTVFAYYGILGGVDLLVLSGGLGFNNEFFANDLFNTLAILNLERNQMIKLKINEDLVMLKKARTLILNKD